MILEIKVKSDTRRDAALDNVARFVKRTKNGWGVHRGQSGNVRVEKGRIASPMGLCGHKGGKGARGQAVLAMLD